MALTSAVLLAGVCAPVCAQSGASQSDPASAPASDPAARAGTAPTSDPAVAPTIEGRVLYRTRFDLGELDRPEVDEISGFLGSLGLRAVTSLEPPEHLAELMADLGVQLPEFMEPVLAPGGAPDGDRYLRQRLRGGDALLITRDPVSLVPGAALHLSALARWDALGEGSWEALVRLADGKVVSLFLGTGAQPEWRPISGRNVVPPQAQSGWLELWLYGRRAGVRDGELGLDDLVLEQRPRLGLAWQRALRRVDPRDEQPLTLRSHGLAGAADPYRLQLAVKGADGRRVWDQSTELLITDAYPMDYTPRVAWSALQLARGLYTLEVTLERADGARLHEVHSFALGGPPPFPRVPGAVKWGVELPHAGYEPRWLLGLAPDAVLVPVEAPPAGAAGPLLADWLRRAPRFEVAGLLHEVRPWQEERSGDLELLTEHVRRWYWDGEPAQGQALLERLLARAPYIEIGYRLPRGVRTAPPPGEALVLASARAPDMPVTRERPTTPQTPGAQGTPAQDLPDPATATAVRDLLAGIARPFSTRIEVPGGDDRSSALARSLYLHAAAAPRAVFVWADEALFEQSLIDGGALPTRAYLAWEFVVGYLSGATFVGEESFDPQATCLVYRRDGEEALVVFTEEAGHELILHAGDLAQSYDSLGTRRPLAGRDGKIVLPVTHDPLLVTGLDLARVRTVGSLVIEAAGVTRSGESQGVEIRLTNHYPGTTRVTLDLALPAGWVREHEVDALRLEAGSEGVWRLAVRVPPALGVEGATRLTGTLRLEPDGRPPVTLPIQREVPLESELVEIRAVGIGPTDADIVIRNRTGETIEARIYLAVEPSGTDRIIPRQTLLPGMEQSFHLSYPEVRGGPPRQLLVSVVMPARRAYANKVFPVP